MDKFEKAIVDAIVQQFFVGIEYRTDYGTQRSEPAATKLASQLLQQNLDEIVKALSKKIDLEKLAVDIAAGLADHLSDSFWNANDDRKKLREKVISRFADIKANQMIEQEKEKG
jgi:hypothetical protein